MNAFKTYMTTKKELEIVESRLRYLYDKEEVLAAKYLGIKQAPIFSETTTHNSPTDDSTVIQFIYEIEDKKQQNGLSIKEEIKTLENERKRLTESIGKMEKALREMEGLEYQLFYLIKVEGKKPKKAVHITAETSGLSLATIWRHYANMKESLK